MISDRPQALRRNWPLSYLLALVFLPMVVGCDGCRRDSDSDSAEEQEQAPLEDFSSLGSRAFPSDSNAAANAIKPGHWLTASQALKSNKFDARGQMQSQVTASGANFQTGVTETAEGVLPTVRPIVLPKGQRRRFEFRILAPVSGNQDQKRIFLNSRFLSAGRSVFFDTGRQPFAVLSGEEFFFVILTTRPQRFAKFQVSDWVRPYRDEYAFKDTSANYRIVFPPTDDLLPLSETMLDWTATSVVLWDDLSPDALTPYQQQAMADWVRFGGRLIVNGADAAEAISNTALADVLPLQPTGNIEMDPGAAEELLRGWSVKTDATTDKQVALMRGQSGRVAVDGKAADDAVPLADSGKLVLTRQVGGGQVIQPRFDVTNSWMVDWGSYDSFVNGALLGRPRRKFVKSTDATDDSFMRQQYFDYQLLLSDPAMNSQFRITARDGVLRSLADEESANSVSASRLDSLVSVNASSGIGGWSDNSDTIRLCREILQSESGIEIPDSSLVVRSLGYYLLILVPLNYLVFRILGRLEYAWLAVPVIAIGGAIWVARAARLDIGFARKQTEIALLEMHPDYQRGHLSRVIAIYNSLTSSYDIEFKSADGVAAPIWDERTDRGTTFRTAFAEGPALSGLVVDSNKTQLVHAEQVVDVGGAINLDAQDNLRNGTSFELFDAFVIEKSEDEKIRVAMVGQCTPGTTTRLRFQEVATPAITDELPMQTIRMLRRLAAGPAMRAGSTRLVARIDASLPGMNVSPTASQLSAQTIVLAHLKHAPITQPKVDVNLISDFRKAIGRPDDEDTLQDENL